MKKLTYFMSVLILALGSFCMLGCQSSRDQVLAVNESQIKLRSMQSRIYDTADKIKTLRIVMATLQDLGFVIDKADDVLGSVSATKLDRYAVRITVNVRPNGETQMLVRANAQYNLRAIEDPEPYQQFFAAFEKSLFLGTHNITVASGGGATGFGEQQKDTKASHLSPAEIKGKNITSTESPERPDEQLSPPAPIKGAMSSGLRCTVCNRIRSKDMKWHMIFGKLVCVECYDKKEVSKTGSRVH